MEKELSLLPRFGAKFLLVLSLTSLCAQTYAATTTTTLAVTATVLTACIVTTTPVAFGNYSPVQATPTTGTGTIITTCTLSSTYTIGLDAGASSGATVTTRKMTFLTNLLPYGLYQDSGHTTNWGNTPGTDTPAATTATGLAQTKTVYGSIPAGATVPAGAYTDTVNVTVTY
ncbi:putative secreted protein [Legionella massiliensis]|uniref:Putative secreted protein n=1 Tax=Legionella massiliensis TaxID=1034943 RepID=A0A078L4Y0_9GAMM|nr:spore coat U domain-containing protein [Legionella massiliensis]CDZ78963.1 putative secreted protein [Legionella massiliensis]CEE14701.1 Spore Coat Protein U domain protein [Legionella massiliensis]